MENFESIDFVVFIINLWLAYFIFWSLLWKKKMEIITIFIKRKRTKTKYKNYQLTSFKYQNITNHDIILVITISQNHNVFLMSNY